MRTWIWSVALVLFSVNAFADDKPLRMDVMGEIAIDHAGAVYDYNVSTILTPEMKQLVERTVRQWAFEPVLRDSKPVYARSSMHLTLLATPVEAGYRLQIEGVRFLGNRPLKSAVRPEYPREAMRVAINAIVLVAARIDANGAVLDAAAARSSLLGVRATDRVAEKWRNRFEESCVRAMRKWTFQPADIAAGDPPETTVLIPMVFRTADTPEFGGGWQTGGLAGPSRPIPWLPEGKQAFDAEGLREGQMLALDNPLKLRIDVEGTTL